VEFLFHVFGSQGGQDSNRKWFHLPCSQVGLTGFPPNAWVNKREAESGLHNRLRYELRRPQLQAQRRRGTLENFNATGIFFNAANASVCC
jgi:hypothetical protein